MCYYCGSANQSSIAMANPPPSPSIEEKYKYINNQHLIITNAICQLQEQLRDSDVAELLITAGSVSARLSRPELSLNINTADKRGCAIEAINFKEYESKDRDIILGVLNYLSSVHEHPVFFDIGSNEGIYSIAALRANSKFRVHCFEPVPDTATCLRSNLALNGVCVEKLNQLAISSETGQAEFNFVPEITGSSSFKDTLNHPSAIKIVVDTMTLDDYFKFSSEIPHFVKIDVEGSELNVLEGWSGLTDLICKPLLFVEILRKWTRVYGYGANSVFQKIVDMGYSGYVCCEVDSLRECNCITDETQETNFLFVPSCFDDVQLDLLKASIKSLKNSGGIHS